MKKFLITFLFTFLIFTNLSSNNANKGIEQGNWNATYYGNKYKTVRHTANGDIFDMHTMTCAAPKKFKFGTKLHITNISNNKSVVVKVTDRGGFGNNTIDLTYGAFGKIANHKSGRIKIKVKVLS